MEDQVLDYCIILLTQGQFAKISPSKYALVCKYKWYARWSKSTRTFYAVTRGRGGQKRPTILMHRLVMGLEKGMKIDCDHINRDTLDNRDENLRLATRSQNLMNRGKNANNTSGFKGVSMDKKSGKWLAYGFIDGKRKALGCFNTPEEAHARYAISVQEMFGEFARID